MEKSIIAPQVLGLIPFIDHIFRHNLQRINKKGLLFYEQPFDSSDISPVCTVSPEYFEHLDRFLGLMEPIINDLSVKGFI
ncbi:hypothetical protein OQX61_09025 [Pedobacter sp. PLR]|uniref:hypothetical protein n=1 Tax=Pedobacter sp. PLR TaxID=2994465 RepID=UPI002246BCC3|nr:hypothetical protein [Pedobacter sp. PLR]MCX2451412.1 hypothetical protein [Pedobacter sp. PLR]